MRTTICRLKNETDVTTCKYFLHGDGRGMENFENKQQNSLKFSKMKGVL